MKFSRTLLASALLLAFSAHAALKVKMGTFDGKSIDAGSLDVVKTLVRGELQQERAYDVVESGEEAVVDGTVIRLESSYILQIRLAEKGERPIARQTKISSFEEMDVAAKRVVTALAHNISVEDTVKRGGVFSREEKEPSRVKAVRGKELLLGLGLPLFSVADDTGEKHTPLLAAISFGNAWDVRRFLIEARGDLLIAMNGQGVGAINGSLAGLYLIDDDGQMAPFVGPELGFGVGMSDWGDALFGFHLGVNAGVLFLREADINLDVRLRLSGEFRELAATGKYPFFASLLVGLHY